MSPMDVPFVVRVAVVSGLAALAVALLRAGMIAAGAVVGLFALAGLIALVRIVVAAERRSQEKRS